MVAGFAVAGLNDLLKYLVGKSKDNKGQSALDQLVQQQTANQGQDMPSAQQAGAMNRAADPLRQMLAGQPQAPMPQQTGIPTQPIDPAMQEAIAKAQALQTAKGRSSGLDFLLGETDPLRQQKLAESDLTQRRGNFDLNALIGQQSTADELAALPAELLPEGMQGPAQRLAGRINPRAQAATLLSQRGVFGQDPTNEIQNYEYAQRLAAAGQDPDELKSWRRDPKLLAGDKAYVKVNPDGSTQEVYSGRQAGQTAGATKISMAEVERQYEGALAAGQVDEDEANIMKLFDDALKHPGFDKTYGINSWVPWTTGGSDAASFAGYLEQAEGGNFLKAYETLKGTGQITEIEGRKAQQAISRIGNVKMSDAEARKAWTELRDIIKRGYARKRAGLAVNRADQTLGRQGMSNPASEILDSAAAAPRRTAPKATRRYNRETGQLEAIQ